MKKWLLFISGNILFLLQVFSQEHFILAGQDTGLIKTKFSTNYLPNFYSDPFTKHPFDINEDGINDIEIVYDEDDDSFMELLISPSHAGVEFLSVDSLGNNNDCNSRVLYTVAFNLNDTINNAFTNWKDSAETIFYVQGGVAPPCSVQGTLKNDTSYFIVGRLINMPDTALFYLHLGKTATHDYGIYDYAIEGRDTTILLTAIKEAPTAEQVTVYPNPFNAEINIKVNAPVEYTISDYLGRTIKAGTTSKAIPTEDVLPGVYLLFIKNNESAEVIKVIKR